MVAGLVAATLVFTGCAQQVDGAAKPGPLAGDPAFFFAGEVPDYGQTVSANDKAVLAYLRAMRRIDVCGLVDRQSFAKIGEISSLGTLYALDECDAEIKMPGAAASRFVSVQVTLNRVTEPPAFRVGPTPIYQTAKETCEYLIPLDLSHLPGAPPLRKPDQPFLRLGSIGAAECDLTRKAAAAVAGRVTAGSLPARDGAAVYPTPLAERDPCEVLAPLASEIDHWDVNRTRAYECEFGVWRDGDAEVLSTRVALEPKIVDIATYGRQLQVRDGADIYLDPTFCSAVSFVGPPMQRRLAGGDFVDVADIVVRPAVVVDSGEAGCAGENKLVVDIAAAAVKLFG
ncbi:hypothetical protein BH09ACT8_BH09ACT8_16320 [soil metagenome]